MLREVLFSKELEAALDMDETGKFKSFQSMRRFFNAMHATTPRDLEETDRLEWLYVIRGGMVHRVATIEDVKAVMRGRVHVPYRETDV
jgi:hypothetical protein